MNAVIDSDGLPRCPDCGETLSCADAHGRDTETIGGYAVEYYQCDECKGEFETIDCIGGKQIYPSGDQS